MIVKSQDVKNTIPPEIVNHYMCERAVRMKMLKTRVVLKKKIHEKI
jgi:hypothetical protein